MISVNPAPSVQEVRDIPKRCCDRIDPQGGQDDADGLSAFYGYGRLNAETAVKLAKPTVSDSVNIIRGYNLPIPDLSVVEAKLEVGTSHAIESMKVHLDIEHAWIGDLVVTLISPAGAATVLHNHLGGGGKNLKKVYDASSTPRLADFNGTSIDGSWTLRIEDKAREDTGTLLRFGIEMKLVTEASREVRRVSGARGSARKTKSRKKGKTLDGIKRGSSEALVPRGRSKKGGVRRNHRTTVGA